MGIYGSAFAAEIREYAGRAIPMVQPGPLRIALELLSSSTTIGNWRGAAKVKNFFGIGKDKNKDGANSAR